MPWQAGCKSLGTMSVCTTNMRDHDLEKNIMNEQHSNFSNVFLDQLVQPAYGQTY